MYLSYVSDFDSKQHFQYTKFQANQREIKTARYSGISWYSGFKAVLMLQDR